MFINALKITLGILVGYVGFVVGLMVIFGVIAGLLG
jgi:hypothetical protein